MTASAKHGNRSSKLRDHISLESWKQREKCTRSGKGCEISNSAPSGELCPMRLPYPLQKPSLTECQVTELDGNTSQLHIQSITQDPVTKRGERMNSNNNKNMSVNSLDRRKAEVRDVL